MDKPLLVAHARGGARRPPDRGRLLLRLPPTAARARRLAALRPVTNRAHTDATSAVAFAAEPAELPAARLRGKSIERNYDTSYNPLRF